MVPVAVYLQYLVRLYNRKASAHDHQLCSADLRKQLKRERYFAELMADKTADRLRFMREVGHVGDVELQVVEMTGEPGDVYFMDLRVLYMAAPNVRPSPRLMLTQCYLLASARLALYGKSACAVTPPALTEIDN